ncbi:MAG: HupE/UreJ family protein, partial [Verrucomicrobiota bacterium]|nr:HupE/UreJ family protein [Verrucomicrobiota bacterium]
SYLTLDVGTTNINGRWDLALRDLDDAIGLDANDDGEITWGEVRAKHEALAAYVQSRLGISVNGKTTTLTITRHEIDVHSDGAYAVIRFTCDASATTTNISVRYNALFDRDPQHRGLLRLNFSNQTRTAIFGPGTSKQEFPLANINTSNSLAAFVKEGVWHIWTGYDHILFLIALLLPGVLRLENGRWIPVASLREALINVLQIVTAFTLAHSLTLSLAALKIISLPSRFVESSIAGSIIIAALNNVWPVMHRRAWIIAFAFGLIHGFGFASVLGDLDLRGRLLALGLFGFNVGVELGQLAIVLVFIPIAFAVRGSWYYREMTLKFGSLLVTVIAGIWMSERLFNFKLLPF